MEMHPVSPSPPSPLSRTATTPRSVIADYTQPRDV